MRADRLCLFFSYTCVECVFSWGPFVDFRARHSVGSVFCPLVVSPPPRSPSPSNQCVSSVQKRNIREYWHAKGVGAKLEVTINSHWLTVSRLDPQSGGSNSDVGIYGFERCRGLLRSCVLFGTSERKSGIFQTISRPTHPNPP